MKKTTFDQAILKYLTHLNNTSTWISDEAYKFEFANYIQSNIDFSKQTDQEILDILINSQSIKYSNMRGVQFIQKSGRKTLSEFISSYDVHLFREFIDRDFNDIDWSQRTMSFTGLSSWLGTLFPTRMYPIPMKGINETIHYLFEVTDRKLHKTGASYIQQCQDFLKLTEEELRKYPIQDTYLKVWNTLDKAHPSLKASQKKEFSQIDWNWLAQDFHLFVHRNILNLYKSKKESITKNLNNNLFDEIELTPFEGTSKLIAHIRYERDSALIKKIKEQAIQKNPMLNCEVCGFSFIEKYGKLGLGFIEAHHKKPLSETKETTTTKKDIALLCSNCHRMIHKGISKINIDSILTIEELRELLITNQLIY